MLNDSYYLPLTLSFTYQSLYYQLLASALGEGETPLVLTVILGDDPIPRFSRMNVISLAGSAKRFLPTAERCAMLSRMRERGRTLSSSELVVLFMFIID